MRRTSMYVFCSRFQVLFLFFWPEIRRRARGRDARAARGAPLDSVSPEGWRLRCTSAGRPPPPARLLPQRHHRPADHRAGGGDGEARREQRQRQRAGGIAQHQRAQRAGVEREDGGDDDQRGQRAEREIDGSSRWRRSRMGMDGDLGSKPPHRSNVRRAACSRRDQRPVTLARAWPPSRSPPSASMLVVCAGVGSVRPEVGLSASGLRHLMDRIDFWSVSKRG